MFSLLLLVAFWVVYGLAQNQFNNLSNLNAGVNVTGMNLSGLPKCAQDCLGDSAAEQAQGGCSAIDIKCLCSNVEYVNVLACCLDTKCSADDQKKTVTFNSGLCQRVNITIPNFLGCAPGHNPFSNSTNTTSTSTVAPSKGGFSTGAKAGIGVGAGVGAVAAIAGCLACLAFRKRQQRHRDEVSRFSSMQYNPSSFTGPVELKRGSMATSAIAPSYRAAYPPMSVAAEQPIVELESPPTTAPLPPRPGERAPLQENELWFPDAVGASNGAPPPHEQPVVEMQGDTHINEHHPAMSPTGTKGANAAATNVEGPVTPFLQSGQEAKAGK